VPHQGAAGARVISTQWPWWSVGARAKMESKDDDVMLPDRPGHCQRGGRTYALWMALCAALWGPSCRGSDNSGIHADAEQPARDGAMVDAPTDGPPCSFSSSSAMDIPVCCGRSGQIQGVNCVPWSTVEENLRNCIKDGEEFDGHLNSLGVACCPGLSNLPPLDETDGATSPGLPDGCSYPRGPSGLRLCRRCGDGVCSGGENRCNCSADCPAR
jgi:hypothetical protein